MKWKDALPAVGAYLQRRLAEPESRAAVGAAATGVAAYMTGHLTAGQMGLAELGAAITFAVPAPIAKELIAAVASAARKPAA